MEVFGIFGLIAFAFAIPAIGLPEKVKRLEKQVKRLKQNGKGEIVMSKMFEELKGKSCKITFTSGVQILTYTVLDIDEDWVKLVSTDKKGIEKTEIVRIEDISKVELV